MNQQTLYKNKIYIYIYQNFDLLNDVIPSQACCGKSQPELL